MRVYPPLSNRFRQALIRPSFVRFVRFLARQISMSRPSRPTPMFGADFSDFLSYAGFVRCPMLIVVLTVTQVGRDYCMLR